MVTMYAVLPPEVRRVFACHLNNTPADGIAAVASAWLHYCRVYHAADMAAVTNEEQARALIAMAADMGRDSEAVRNA
jgi:hypothetical protein